MGSGGSTAGGDGGIESVGVGDEVVARSSAGLIDRGSVSCGRSGTRSSSSNVCADPGVMAVAVVVHKCMDLES
jgi:hypothetical protein